MNLMKIEQNLTMTSREIAELTGKQHKHVLEDIRNMLSELELTPAGFTADLFDSYGRPQPGFALPKRETLILVSGYNLAMRAKIIDRWQELEAKEPKPSFAIPQTMSEALILAGQQMQLAEERKLQLELAAPKVDYVDKYVDRGALKKVTDVAKEMKTTAIRLGKWLRHNKYAFKTTDKIIWTKEFIDKGYGEMKKFTSDSGYDGTQSLVTAAGDLFIKQNFTK